MFFIIVYHYVCNITYRTTGLYYCYIRVIQVKD